MGLARNPRSARAALPKWARWVLAVYLIWLAAVVMVLDVAANMAGNWSRIQRDPAWPFTGSGLLLIAVFAVFVLATAPATLRATRRAASAALSWGVCRRKQGQNTHDNLGSRAVQRL